MKTIFTNSILTLVFASACTSIQHQEWQKRKESQEFLQEKVTFRERLGGKMPCWETGVANFTWTNDSPSKECLYPSGAYSYLDRELGQASKALKVIQVAPNGFIVATEYQDCIHTHCFNKQTPNNVFIFRTDEKGIVDGSFLDETFNWSLYEYAGPFTYNTVVGPKTIRSFKKIPEDTIKNAKKGLSTYDPYQELLAELGLWHKMGNKK